MLRFIFILGLVAFALANGPAFAADKKKSAKAEKESSSAHMREELGVNQFTAPSIDTVLQALKELRPVPYEKVERPLPARMPSDRFHLALTTGGVIADGFLVVIAEKQSRIEGIGKALLQLGKGLGVSDSIFRHSKSIMEKAGMKDWDGVRAELIGTQKDMEQGMMALKDEELAHLIALGGWWRGVEISAGIIEESFTPERATLLVQPSVLDYFIDRVSTLHPNLKKTALWAALDTNLQAVKKIISKQGALTLDEVKKIHELAKATNDAIAKDEE